MGPGKFDRPSTPDLPDLLDPNADCTSGSFEEVGGMDVNRTWAEEFVRLNPEATVVDDRNVTVPPIGATRQFPDTFTYGWGWTWLTTGCAAGKKLVGNALKQGL